MVISLRYIHLLLDCWMAMVMAMTREQLSAFVSDITTITVTVGAILLGQKGSFEEANMIQFDCWTVELNSAWLDVVRVAWLGSSRALPKGLFSSVRLDEFVESTQRGLLRRQHCSSLKTVNFQLPESSNCSNRSFHIDAKRCCDSAAARDAARTGSWL